MFIRKLKSYNGSFSHKTRRKNLKRLQREEFDLAVIGGGITGAGIARDAAMRGLKVALIEKQDFASGTSSKSSKMIHGGLRYLKQLDIRMVKESLGERETLLHLAPHLVRSVPYLIPIYSGWMARFETRIGLIGYDFLKGDDSLERHRNQSSEQVLNKEPLLRRENLFGGFIYHDCLVDDARLTLITVKSAHEHGAVATNYTQAIGFDATGHLQRQVKFRDVLTGKRGAIRARVVVAAGGPWTDELLDLHGHAESMLRNTKGIHLVFPKERLHVHRVIVVPSRDKRMIFAAPRGEFTYAGTTDTDYTGPLDAVRVEDRDVRYLLEALNRFFPSRNLVPADIVSSWAGLRPLLKEGGAPSKLSRDYEVTFYEDGLAVIAGGKLTTYRAMAKNLLDQALQRYAHRLQGDFQPCRTAETALVGGEMADFPAYLRAQSLSLVDRWHLAPQTAAHLLKSYGRNHMDILALGARDRELLEPLRSGCAFIKGEVVYAVEEEMALTLEDFMSRRTDMMYFDGQLGLPVVKTVAKLMGRLLGWSRARRKAEIRQYRQAAREIQRFGSSAR